MELTVETLAPGVGQGSVLTLTEPLSFWGGVDAETGTIIDAAHPQLGAVIAGTVLVMPHSRGSSSASSVLAECIRAGTAPMAIVLHHRDPMMALGSLAAAELYPDRLCPVVVAGDSYNRIAAAATAAVAPDVVTIEG